MITFPRSCCTVVPSPFIHSDTSHSEAFRASTGEIKQNVDSNDSIVETVFLITLSAFQSTLTFRVIETCIIH